MHAVSAFTIDPANEVIPEEARVSVLESEAAKYKIASVGATTEEPKRLDRLEALRAVMLATE